MNYDPDRELWLPSRRKFFFLGLAAGVAPFLPDVPVPAWTVQMEIKKAGGIWQTYTAIFPKDRPSKPSQFLIDGNHQDVAKCPLTLSTENNGFNIGWGSDGVPNVSLVRHVPMEPTYISQVQMFENTLLRG